MYYFSYIVKIFFIIFSAILLVVLKSYNMRHLEIKLLKNKKDPGPEGHRSTFHNNMFITAKVIK